MVKRVRTKLEAPDASGRLQPVPVSGTEFDISVDMVITAIGQKSDLLLLPKAARAPFIVELLTLETALPGVFAGGDMVAGPSSVVEAIASGKRAAISIDRFLKGEDLKVGRDEEVMRVNKPPKGEIEKRPRCLTPLLPVKQRTGNFQEVQTGFSEELAAVEAQRCMACGSKAFIKYVRDCQSCYLCKMVCPEEAIEVMPVFERRMPLA